VALPEVCLLTATACSLAADLLAGLEVDVDAMSRNLDDYSGSEQALAVLSSRLGRHAAREALQTTLADGRRAGEPMAVTLVNAGLLDQAEAAALRPDPGACGEMVDLVVARARDVEADP
jgi:adenylosuccinate lyase